MDGTSDSKWPTSWYWPTVRGEFPEPPEDWAVWNIVKAATVKTCHYCQSRRRFSQRSGPKPPPFHPTQVPSSEGSQAPVSYSPSTHTSDLLIDKKLTRFGKEPCRTVLTQSPECRSQRRSPLETNFENQFWIFWSMPSSPSDHPMSIRSDARECSAPVLLQSHQLLEKFTYIGGCWPTWQEWSSTKIYSETATRSRSFNTCDKFLQYDLLWYLDAFCPSIVALEYQENKQTTEEGKNKQITNLDTLRASPTQLLSLLQRQFFLVPHAKHSWTKTILQFDWNWLLLRICTFHLF